MGVVQLLNVLSLSTPVCTHLVSKRMVNYPNLCEYLKGSRYNCRLKCCPEGH